MCMVNNVTIMSNGMIYKNTCYSIGTEQIVNTKKVGFYYRIIDRIEIIGYFVFFPFDMYI